MGTERPNLDDEFQEADDRVIEDAAILQEIEHDRRDVPVGDPAQVDLSEIAADTARDLPETRRGGNGTSPRSSARNGSGAMEAEDPAVPRVAGGNLERRAGPIVSLANKEGQFGPPVIFTHVPMGHPVGGLVGQTRQAAPGDYPKPSASRRGNQG